MDTSRLNSLPLDQQHLVHKVTTNLQDQFVGTFGPETIERFVVDSVALLLPTANVTSFLPVLAEKFTKDRLRALGKADGSLPSTVPGVLFLCVHNAGRSQMAAALLAYHGGGRVVVRSAGTAPAETINPAVVAVMAEIGIDLHATGAHPKRLDEAAVRASDVVITMGCGDTCPYFPGKRYEDWALDDPAGQGVDAVRPIRDEIDRRVRELLADLVG